MITRGSYPPPTDPQAWLDQNIYSGSQTSAGQVSDSDSAELPDVDFDHGDEYEIEKIVNCKIEDGKVYYRIKWRGYSGEDCTWEAEENLEKCPNFLISFYDQIDGLTENRDIFKMSVDPETGKVSLDCRNHKTYPVSKFCSSTKDLLTNRKTAFIEDDDLSDMSEFEDDDKKIVSESSVSKEYSVSSLDSVKNQPEGLLQPQKKGKKLKNKSKKKKHVSIPKRNTCYFFEGHRPQEILSHRVIGKDGGRTQLELLIKWRKNPETKERPKNCYYLADSLKILVPEMLADYYKSLLIKMLDEGMAKREQMSKLRFEAKARKAVQKDDPEISKSNKTSRQGRKNLVDYLGSKTQAQSTRKKHEETMKLVEKLGPKPEPKPKPPKKDKKDKKKSMKDKKQEHKSVDLTGFEDFTVKNKTKKNYFLDGNSEIVDDEEIFCE